MEASTEPIKEPAMATINLQARNYQPKQARSWT